VVAIVIAEKCKNILEEFLKAAIRNNFQQTPNWVS